MKLNQLQAKRSESARFLNVWHVKLGNAIPNVEWDQCSESVQFRGPLGEKVKR